MDKTHFLIFSRKRINVNVSLYLDDLKLKQKKVTKFLGIFIDNKFNWTEQIKHVIKKVNRNIGIIWKIRNSLNKSAKKLLYYALIHSHLHYGNCVWGTGPKTELQPLIIAQKKIIRIISSAQYREHTNGLFKSLNILKLPEINNLATVKFVQSQVYSQDPIVNFRRGNQVHDYNTRSANHLRPNRHSVIVTKRFISNRGCNLWNSLPSNLKEITNTNSFKIKTKKYFMSLY